MSKPPRQFQPEVMSPAGYWPQLQAAVEAGADAVYFGLKHFSARAKVGFTLTELPEVMHTLHQRSVRGYVTFNTLVFDHELLAAARTLAAIAAASVDAIIVQDLGIARLAREIAPSLELHGSTQMSLTSAEGLHLAQQLGITRVVLARELSLAEVRAIRAQTDCELEMFVHGALCVSYSGQCFSSEAWGGRSANRGQCAQACRLPYTLLVDGQVQPLGAARYLLSPGDLATLQHIPDIVQLGISALKIEGRYKDADYVALTTRAYRQAVDAACAGLPLDITPLEHVHLEQVYSRGLGDFFISGTNHQAVVQGRAPRHRGVLLGRVVRVPGQRVIIAPAPVAEVSPLKPGDGLVFDAADWRSPEEPEEGGRVYHVTPLPGGHLELQFGNGAINPARIRPGDLVWRTSDPDLEKQVRRWTQAPAPVRKQPVRLYVKAHEGTPLVLEWILEAQPDLRVTVQADLPPGPAEQRVITVDFLHEQCGRLGNTPYELVAVELDLRGRPFVPSSLLNRLRREAIAHLAEQQGRPPPVTLADPVAVVTTALEQVPHAEAGIEPPAPQIHLLVRTPEQLEAALDLHPASITLDYLDLYGLKPAVARVKDQNITVRVASPRILKPGEEKIVRFLRNLDCQILVRSSGLLMALQSEPHPPLIGDFSLNAANVLTADMFLRMGLLRLTPTHDLNAAQIAALAHRIGADRIEVPVYHHLPVFHTEHCVFCRFLSRGTSYKDCGHPCEKQRIAVQDDKGRAHPVMADVGCRNTVFGAEAQEASRQLETWRAAEIHHLRLEFVHETADQVTQITHVWRDTLNGTRSAQSLTRQLARLAPQGVTEGSLFVPENHLILPVLG